MGNYGFRYDPLYRVVDVTDEMHYVEGEYKSKIDRLREINNLGIIPEVFGMAKYTKYEHTLGTNYQINSMLDILNDEIIPDIYREPLKLASIFLHLGHFPFTYSTERALILASNIGDPGKDNKAKSYVNKIVKKILNKTSLSEEDKARQLDRILSFELFEYLYRYISAEIIIDSWNNLESKYGFDDRSLDIIIKNLIDDESDGFDYLNLANQADFVQRDALYFGTVRLDISPKHLYKDITRYEPNFYITEKNLIEANYRYLNDSFYNHDDVICFSTLYEKILAGLIIDENFDIDWLKEYNDDKLKRLMTCNCNENYENLMLDDYWIKQADSLFKDFKVKSKYPLIFELNLITFPEEKNILDLESMIIGESEINETILKYPFERGIIINVIYVNTDDIIFSILSRNYRTFNIKVYQDDSKKNLIELLRIIKNLSRNLSIYNISNIRTGLANQLSWTRRSRFKNDEIIRSIVEAIKYVEKNKNLDKLGFIEEYLKKVREIREYDSLWADPQNYIHFFGAEFFSQIYEIIHNTEPKSHGNPQIAEESSEDSDRAAESKTQEPESSDKVYENIYKNFANGLLSLPCDLLQHQSILSYLSDIYDALFENLLSCESSEKKGNLFEALCLIDKIRNKKGKFQLYLNGMVVVDPARPKKEQDSNEFDIIEFVINEADQVECEIYACSIAPNYRQINQGTLTQLVDNIHAIFPKIIIKSRYLIPRNRDNDWTPTEEDTGRNYSP